MQMRELLKGLNVYAVTDERGITVNGEKAILFRVHQRGYKTPHIFTFATANKMSEEHMADVMRSYLRKNVTV